MDKPQHDFEVEVAFENTWMVNTYKVKATSAEEACKLAMEAVGGNYGRFESVGVEVSPDFVTTVNGGDPPSQFNQLAMIHPDAYRVQPQQSHREFTLGSTLRLELGAGITALPAGLQIGVSGRGYVLIPWGSLRDIAHQCCKRAELAAGC